MNNIPVHYAVKNPTLPRPPLAKNAIIWVAQCGAPDMRAFSDNPKHITCPDCLKALAAK